MMDIINSRFFLRMLRYFCVFLILACITMVSTFLITSREIENQYRTKARNDLATLGNTVDTLFSQVSNAGTTFFFDNVVEGYFKPSDRLTEQIRAEIWKIPRKIQQDEQTFSQLVENSYAFFSADRAIYTSAGTYESGFFFSTMNSYSLYPASFWLESLKETGRRFVLPPSPLRTPAGTSHVIPVVTTYRMAASTAIHVSNVSMRKLVSLFPQGSMDGESYYIITDELGNTLVNTAERVVASSTLETLLAITGEGEASIQGDPYLVFQQRSGQTGWTFYMLLPKTDLTTVLTMNLYISLGTGGGILLLGLFLTFIFSLSLSRPITSLATSVTSAGAPGDGGKTLPTRRQDELSLLQSGVAHLLSENKKLVENEANYNYEYIEHSLLMLLHGLIPDDMEKLKAALLTWWNYSDDLQFICSIVLCDLDEPLYNTLNPEGIHHIMKEIATTISETVGQVPILSIQNGMFAFITASSQEDGEEAVKAICRDLISTFASRSVPYPVSIGIGAPVRGISHMVSSYNQALGALQARTSDQQFSVQAFSDLQPKDRVGFSFYNQKNIVFAVRNKDDGSLSSILEDILRKNHHRLISLADRQELYRQLILVGQRCMEEHGLKIEDLPRYQYIRNALMTAGIQDDPREATRNIQLLFSLILEETKNNGTPPARLIELVKAYILESYADILSLEIIAEHFHVSSKYLSHLFKQHTGETLTTTIALIRVEKAKQLLRTTNLKVSDIGSKVGMDSRATFQRVFKKIEGVSPQEYRHATESITLPG